MDKIDWDKVINDITGECNDSNCKKYKKDCDRCADERWLNGLKKYKALWEKKAIEQTYAELNIANKKLIAKAKEAGIEKGKHEERAFFVEFIVNDLGLCTEDYDIQTDKRISICNSDADNRCLMCWNESIKEIKENNQ